MRASTTIVHEHWSTDGSDAAVRMIATMPVDWGQSISVRRLACDSIDAMQQLDWFEYLRLAPDATAQEIEQGVERLSRQAAALAVTAPERSQRLRDTVREIKRDLLSGPENRARYDAARAALAPPGPLAPPAPVGPGLARAAFPQGARVAKFLRGEAEADSTAVGQMEIDIYLDTDEESVASSVFMAVDELAKAVAVDDTVLMEFRRGSFIKRSKASIQSGLSDAAVQQRLQSLERFVGLWQIDPRQAEVDQRTSEAFERMINCLEKVPRACIRFGSLLIVKYPDGAGYVLLCRQLSQSEIGVFEKYPELQTHPETILAALALAISRNNEPEPPESGDPIGGL